MRYSCALLFAAAVLAQPAKPPANQAPGVVDDGSNVTIRGRNLVISPLDTPQTPTLTVLGTSGFTTYSYAVVAKVPNGSISAPSVVASVSSGNATLSASNPVSIRTYPITGASSCDVYRTVGGSTQGKIANVACGDSLSDIGLTADGSTLPSSSTTGNTTFNGNVSASNVALSGNVSMGTTVLVNPSCDGTTDKRAVIQAAINANPEIYITAQVSACVLSSPMSIPSNRTIRVDPTTVIKLADGAMASGGASFAVNADFSSGNSNIIIDGGVWDGNNANQTRLPDAPGGYYTGVGFRFVNQSGLVLSHLTIRNPLTFGLQCANCSSVTSEDVTLDYSNKLDNMDGLHFNGPASKILVRNLNGPANDDMICLCADDGSAAQITHGAISQVLIDGVNGAYRGVRFLSDTDDIRNVTVRQVTGSYALDGVLFSYLSTHASTISGITLEDIKPSASRNAVRFERGVNDIVLTRVSTASATGGIGFIGSPTVGFGATTQNGPISVNSLGGVLNISNPAFSGGSLVYGLSIDYLGRLFWGYQNSAHIFRLNSGTAATLDSTGFTLSMGTIKAILPTSCSGLASGTLYNNSGTPAICP